MLSWNHRVIKSVGEDGEFAYQIHKVYFTQAGELALHTEHSYESLTSQLK